MPRIVENALVVYTDGSLYPRGRKGGYGAVFIHIDDVGAEKVVLEHAPPGVGSTTGNRMELQACIDAFKLAPTVGCFSTVDKLVIRTDSAYVRFVETLDCTQYTAEPRNHSWDHRLDFAANERIGL